jgi:DNA mismatch endonuclease, patch repair protein
MVDIFTCAKRSEIMSRIRGRGNRDTELALAKLLRDNGLSGWRRNQPIFGKPDFVFPKLKVALFVDGCFWHSCPKHATRPRNNEMFWQTKFARNQARDLTVTRTLRMGGWTVVRIWEHELHRKKSARLLRRIRRIMSARS